MNALIWPDVGLDRGVVLIHASVKRSTAKLSTTKRERKRLGQAGWRAEGVAA